MSKNTHYSVTENNPHFPLLEKNILEFWQKNNVFQSSIDTRPALHEDGSSNAFIFYDGPPFANGLPHYGHLLTGYVKDAVGRYQTLLGKRVERRFGWDCHGLPAEMGAEKELSITGRAAIIDYGIERFNDYCQKSVMHYTNEWKTYVDRQGRWVDMENAYKTMDLSFMETVLWVFKSLYEKGLIYQSLRVMPYSWACETPLSHFETRLDNSYRERADKAVTVSFTLKEKPACITETYESYKILAWTTTPWTLPSNLALAVGENIEYSYVVRDNVCYILAASAIKNYAKEFPSLDDEKPCFLGKQLENMGYVPLFPYFVDHENAFKILIGDFVTDSDGTGCVHIAPGFGEDDQALCQKHAISIVCPIDTRGHFTKDVTDFAGMLIWDANDEIIKHIKHMHAWIRTEQYIHNYPHCWRTDTPLIYKAVPSWYVKVTEIKDRMVELNKEVHWVPEHIRDGLFGTWLSNARDWSISRNRFFGTPIPVWMSDNPDYPRIDVYGSIEELEAAFNTKITDLHRPHCDNLTRPNPDDPTGKSMMRRVEDVFDCWFEAGSVPYGQVHYPFKDKALFEKSFPADFIVEYTAQTRGWFYTLFILSTALWDRPPFLNCICHGVVLDEAGQKLSKRLKNYADPLDLFGEFGSDALRWLMISSQVMQGGELRIDKEGKMVRDALRLVIKPLWNAWYFFSLYANIDHVEGKIITHSPYAMDQYILAKCRHMVLSIERAFNSYNLPHATVAVEQFLDVLNNWYIRRNRSRFWKTEQDDDKIYAYNTLYTVLMHFSVAVSPLLPFITEAIYLGLQDKTSEVALSDNSVHLQTYPKMELIKEEESLMQHMDKIREICNVALSLRHAHHLRVRLPLTRLTLISYENNEGLLDFVDLIKDEVNVKEVVFQNNIHDYAESVLQLHFPVLGKRLPHKMKDLLAASKKGQYELSSEDSIILMNEKILKEEYRILLKPKKEAVGIEILGSNKELIMLDIAPTEALHQEGLARDIVRFIQQTRKDSGYHVSDRIMLIINAEPNVITMLEPYYSYIAEQTLASQLTFKGDTLPHMHKALYEENETITIGFARAE